MIKKNIWPFFHRFRFNKNIKDCWGFLEQKDIYPIKRKCIRGTKTNYDLSNECKEGMVQGYKQIYNTYYKRDNFLNYLYTTPKLSIALNKLNQITNHEPPLLDFNSLKVYQLNSNIEYGLSKMNNKILGLWTPSYIKNEIMIGMIGPEFQSIWHQQPIRENKNILYQFKNRMDIWTWQRCLLTKNSPWVVYNINNIII